MNKKDFIEYPKTKYTITLEIKDSCDSLSNIYFQDNYYYYVIATPHSGNDYKYLTRKNCQSTFDRWSNCDEEYFFDNFEQIIKFLERSE